MFNSLFKKIIPSLTGILAGILFMGFIEASMAGSERREVCLNGEWEFMPGGEEKFFYPPSGLSITEPKDGYVTILPSATVTGTIDSNAQVTVNGLTATVTNYSFTVSDLPLQIGANTINVIATYPDLSTISKNITVHRIHRLEVTFPAQNYQTKDPVINVSGTTGEMITSVYVSGIAATISGNNFILSNFNLVQGRNNLHIEANYSDGERLTQDNVVSYAPPSCGNNNYRPYRGECVLCKYNNSQRHH